MHRIKKWLLFVLVFSAYTIAPYGPPIGLGNLGNSCFCNALTQNLLNITPFMDLFAQSKWWFDMPVVNDFGFLAKEITKQRRAGNTTSYAGLALKNWYNTSQRFFQMNAVKLKRDQRDASELWTFFFTYLNSDDLCGMKKALETLQVFNSSFSHDRWQKICQDKDRKRFVEGVNNLFWNKLISYVEESKGLTVDHSNQLSISIFGTKLEASIESFFTPERVENYQLPSGQLVTATKRFFLGRKTSDCLIVHLKRFRTELHEVEDVKTKQKKKVPVGIKINTPLAIPPVLNMEPYIYLNGEINTPGSYIYQLVGVVVHAGSLEAGHYWAYVNDLYDVEDHWYQCNDASITDMQKNMKSMQDDITKHGYISFYMRKSRVDDLRKLAQERRAIENLAQSLASLAK